MIRFLFEYALPLDSKPSIADHLRCTSSNPTNLLASRGAFAMQALRNLESETSFDWEHAS